MDDFEFSLFSAPPPKKRDSLLVRSRKIFGQFVFLILLFLSAGGGALAGLVFVYSSDLPRVQELEDYRPDVMTELYADDGTVIGSFALEHRVIVESNQIPPLLRNAVLSIEDRHFESHWGVDIIRSVHAGLTDLLEWRKAQGASTLTMQLSRMLFLSREKSFRRKIQEILLAIQIERRYTKSQIFTMYANQVDLGSGNFGFEAAAQYYFGKHLNDLSLSEAATLAGIPQNPSIFSPIRHPERTLHRRNEVLEAMYGNGKISRQELLVAKAAPLGLHIQKWNNNIAPYFVEDVRQFLEHKYGAETVQSKGLRVYTTLNIHQQEIAERALRQGLRDDDKRRGWRGPGDNILRKPRTLPNGDPVTLANYRSEDWTQAIEPGKLIDGLVMDVKPAYAVVRFGQLTAHITPADFAWTHKTTPQEIFSPGDVDLFVIREAKGNTIHATLDQTPDVQGALIVIDNATGGIKAMLGGYDFDQSKFNRTRQAERQAGSSFKVYVYAQALLDGASPFDTVSDTPISFPSSSGLWSPHDYDNRFEGTITLLHALAESRNVPAVRLLAKVGVDKVIKLCRRFGITSRLVPNLPLALGASDLTLLEHSSAFTTFPDDGVRIEPRSVLRVTNYDGRVIDNFPPEVFDVLSSPVARLETSMLREVFNSGTAVRAKALAQKYSLAGKTGTTNDFADAWFIGFSPSLTCGVWVGFDDHRTLGPREEGAKVALPIWMDFMSEALKNQPPEDFSYSPLLTNPEQIKEILSSAGTERLLPESPSAPANSGAAAVVLPTRTVPKANGASDPALKPLLPPRETKSNARPAPAPKTAASSTPSGPGVPPEPRKGGDVPN